MLSQTVEYALRAVVCLAQNPQHALTTAQISELTRVPASYLSKVLQSLVKSGFVAATRGIYGGYALALPAQDISILKIVNAIDPLRRIHECPLGLVSHGKRLCPLHKRLDHVMEQAEEAFAASSLAELLSESNGSTPLCESGEGKLKK